MRRRQRQGAPPEAEQEVETKESEAPSVSTPAVEVTAQPDATPLHVHPDAQGLTLKVSSLLPRQKDDAFNPGAYYSAGTCEHFVFIKRECALVRASAPLVTPPQHWAVPAGTPHTARSSVYWI